jgi:hypothetical protein
LQVQLMKLVLSEWPDWWDWELEITAHCLKRMQDRNFNETDLRTMLEDATSLSMQPDGTFVAETTHDDSLWEVIIVPDLSQRRVVVVTAYPNS